MSFASRTGVPATAATMAQKTRCACAALKVVEKTSPVSIVSTGGGPAARGSAWTESSSSRKRSGVTPPYSAIRRTRPSVEGCVLQASSQPPQCMGRTLRRASFASAVMKASGSRVSVTARASACRS